LERVEKFEIKRILESSPLRIDFSLFCQKFSQFWTHRQALLRVLNLLDDQRAVDVENFHKSVVEGIDHRIDVVAIKHFVPVCDVKIISDLVPVRCLPVTKDFDFIDTGSDSHLLEASQV